MTKEQLIASVSAHYEDLNTLNKIDSFYDYESDFIKLGQRWAGRFWKRISAYFLATGEKKL